MQYSQADNNRVLFPPLGLRKQRKGTVRRTWRNSWIEWATWQALWPPAEGSTKPADAGKKRVRKRDKYCYLTLKSHLQPPAGKILSDTKKQGSYWLNTHRSASMDTRQGGEWVCKSKQNASTHGQDPQGNTEQAANTTQETSNSTFGWSKRCTYGISGRKSEKDRTEENIIKITLRSHTFIRQELVTTEGTRAGVYITPGKW